MGQKLFRTGSLAFLVFALCVLLTVSLTDAPRAQLASSPWPMFHHDPAHSGSSSIDTSANNGIEQWSFDYADSAFAPLVSPVIGPDGTIYSTPGNEFLYAVNPDGTLKWLFTAPWPMTATPAIGADGTIYVTSVGSIRTGYIYAVNPDGTLKWSFATGMEVESSPVIGSDGTVYVYCDDGILYALNADGSEKWQAPVGPAHLDELSSPAIAADGTIYVGTSDGHLYAVSADGSVVWWIQIGGGIESSPAVAPDGTIYVGSDGLYAINPDGSLKWQHSTGAYAVLSSPAIGVDGTIYYGDGDSITALNPDGGVKWQVFTQDTNAVISSPAIGGDGTIYVGTNDQYIYAVNPDGTIKWEFPTGAFPLESSPAIGSDGTIYINLDIGGCQLYAIGQGVTATPSATPTPQASGKIIVKPRRIRFRSVGIGNATVTKTLRIKNSSATQSLTGSVGTLVAPFAISSPGAFHLGPGTELTETITFRPTLRGATAQPISIQSSDSGKPDLTVAVSGSGVGDQKSKPTGQALWTIMSGYYGAIQGRALLRSGVTHPTLVFGNPSVGASSLTFDKSGNLWGSQISSPATDSNSFIFELTPSELLALKRRHRVFPAIVVHAVAEIIRFDAQGNLWGAVGTNSSERPSLFMYGHDQLVNGASPVPERVFTFVDAVGDITDFTFDAAGNIWLDSDYVYNDFDSPGISELTPDQVAGSESSLNPYLRLPGTGGNAVVFDSGGDLWAASASGLNMYPAADLTGSGVGLVQPAVEINPDGQIGGIAFDAFGSLWASLNFGPSRYGDIVEYAANQLQSGENAEPFVMLRSNRHGTNIRSPGYLTFGSPITREKK